MSRRTCSDGKCNFDCYVQYSWNADVLRQAKAGSPSVCEKCAVKNEAKNNDKGSEVHYAEIDAYVNGPKGAKSAVILVHDLFGWRMPNARVLADRFAEQGFLAVIPDFYRRNEWTIPQNSPEFSMPKVMAFLGSHPDERVQGDLGDTCDWLRKVKGVQKIGAVGYCWGGRAAYYGSMNGKLDCVVSLHGGGVEPSIVKNVKCPIFFGQAELDTHPKTETVVEIQKKLQQVKKEAELKVYKGVNHGFAIRADPTDSVAVKAAEEAFHDTAAYFKKKLC